MNGQPHAPSCAHRPSTCASCSLMVSFLCASTPVCIELQRKQLRKKNFAVQLFFIIFLSLRAMGSKQFRAEDTEQNRQNGLQPLCRHVAGSWHVPGTQVALDRSTLPTIMLGTTCQLHFCIQNCAYLRTLAVTHIQWVGTSSYQSLILDASAFCPSLLGSSLLTIVGFFQLFLEKPSANFLNHCLLAIMLSRHVVIQLIIANNEIDFIYLYSPDYLNMEQFLQLEL